MEIELIRNNTMGIMPSTLGHGFFIFDAPPFETEFGYRGKVEPGDLTDTCWGICRNGVPLELPTEDDYFGIAVVDKDRKSIVHGYYTTVKIPAYEYVSWYTAQDVIMPTSDWHLICYVGYYDPIGDILYHTDYKEFTIKTGTPFKKIFPWLLLLAIPLAIPLLKKFK